MTIPESRQKYEPPVDEEHAAILPTLLKAMAVPSMPPDSPISVRKPRVAYLTVKRPGHPRATPVNGVVFKHILIAEEALGGPLPERAEVHHVNGKKQDNRNANLVICEDRGYHMQLHMRERALDACGNANWRKCKYCKRYDDPTRLTFAVNRKSGSAFHRQCRADAESQQGWYKRRELVRAAQREGGNAR